MSSTATTGAPGRPRRDRRDARASARRRPTARDGALHLAGQDVVEVDAGPGRRAPWHSARSARTCEELLGRRWRSREPQPLEPPRVGHRSSSSSAPRQVDRGGVRRVDQELARDVGDAAPSHSSIANGVRAGQPPGACSDRVVAGHRCPLTSRGRPAVTAGRGRADARPGTRRRGRALIRGGATGDAPRRRGSSSDVDRLRGWPAAGNAADFGNPSMRRDSHRFAVDVRRRQVASGSNAAGGVGVERRRGLGRGVRGRRRGAGSATRAVGVTASVVPFTGRRRTGWTPRGGAGAARRDPSPTA